MFKLEKQDKKRMDAIFDFYEKKKIDMNMKFPEATAWNYLIEFDEELLDTGCSEGGKLFDLCCEVLENSSLKKCILKK